MKIADKCAGCLLLGEYHDMGGKTPVCVGCPDLIDAIKATQSTGPCEIRIRLNGITSAKPQTNINANSIRDIVSSVAESSNEARYSLEKLSKSFREALCDNPCKNCIHDSVCGGRTHEDEICDEYAELCLCSECAYNYGLRNGLEFSPDDIVCSLWDSDGFTERDFCSSGKKLASLTDEELFEIMDEDEITKFKAREGKKDGLSAHVTIIDEMHNIRNEEREDAIT